MQVTLFSGGLGDVIRACYNTRSYQFLCETQETVAIVSASHNPFTTEIFRHHQNARHFLLLDLAHKYAEYFSAGLRGADISLALCEFAGLDYANIVRGRITGYTPTFDAPDNVPSQDHIVFQPFAGSVTDRTWPPHLIERVAAILRRLPCQVYLVTRSYPRISFAQDDSLIHGIEDGAPYAGGNITILSDLSAPASINLVKTARAFIGSWSSLHQVAWLENKPVAVFYPPNYYDVRNRTGYAFGLDRTNTYARDFKSITDNELQAFLNQWCLHPTS